MLWTFPTTCDRLHAQTSREAETIIAFLEWASSPAADHPLGEVHGGPVVAVVRSYWAPRAGRGRMQP